MTRAKLILAAIGGTVSYSLGGWDTLLQGLVLLVGLDYATGLLVAAANRQVNSYASFRGIVKKILYFVLVAVAVVIDGTLAPENVILRNYVITFLLINEAISILENCVSLGLPVPKLLKETLDNYQQMKKGGAL